jgi:hypothetical protein
MLRRDPDLQNLRDHPRFQRWVSAAFCMAHPETEDGDPDDRTTLAQLRSQDWDNDGVFGAGPCWNTWSLHWCAIHDAYLVECVTDLALMIVTRWRTLHTRPTVGRDAAWERDVANLMSSDVEAWRHLAAYRQFAWNPIMRHTTMETLARAAGHRTVPAPFPSRNDSLLRPRKLLDLDATLEPLIQASESAAHKLSGAPAAGPLWRLRSPRRFTSDLATACEEAASRWETLLDHFTSGTTHGNGGLTTAPAPVHPGGAEKTAPPV